MVDVIDILSHMALFTNLPPAELAILAREIRRFATKPDRHFFGHGAPRHKSKCILYLAAKLLFTVAKNHSPSALLRGH